ncbi:hypothetical protein D3C81_1826430 [compost metagenome]
MGIRYTGELLRDVPPDISHHDNAAQLVQFDLYPNHFGLQNEIVLFGAINLRPAFVIFTLLQLILVIAFNQYALQFFTHGKTSIFSILDKINNLTDGE